MVTNIIGLILVICIIFLVYDNYYLSKEDFSQYTRCHQKPLKGIMKQIFDKFNITKNDKDYNLYIPCGYNKIESELKNMTPKNNEVIYGISGCDKIVSKNSLWKIIFDHYGREKASKIMPESYLLNNERDMIDFKKKYNNKNTYILKKNLQRKMGIKLTKNYNTIMDSRHDKFKVVQNYIDDVFIINKRKMNLRMYMLIVCKGDKTNIYMHNLGKCLYTSKDFNDNDLSFEENITNSYEVEDHIRQNNPLTVEHLKDYLDKNNYNSQLLFKNINSLMKNLVHVIHKPLGKLEHIKNNLKFQLFGLDIIFTKKMIPYLLEINKGPDMKAKDIDDTNLKSKIQIDTYEKVKLINVDDPEYKNNYIRIL